MARRLPATRPPMPRVITYNDPQQMQYLTVLTPLEAAQKKARDAQLYARWVQRQALIAERDGKARRVWLGFGATLGLAVLAALVVVGWLAWTVLGLGLLAVPLLIALTAGLAVGGHRCITIVQHMH
jgi:fatty acid desaturase